MRRACIAALAVLCLAAPSSAGSTQLSAGDAPRTSGPVRAQGKHECGRQNFRFEGRVVAKMRMCLWLFELDDDAEDDDDRDFGAVWMQSTVDPEPGYCAVRVSNEITVPSPTEVIGRAPRAGKFTKKTPVTTTLDLDAGGKAKEEAAIANDHILHKGKLTWRRNQPAGGDTKSKLTWKGTGSEKLAFVTALEISWPKDGAPPERVPFSVRYPLRRC